jgi:hypothetical protein
MLTEIAQPHPVWQVPGHKGRDGVREQNLAAMRRNANAGRPMNVHPNVAALRDVGLAGVKPNADPHGRTVGPWMPQDALLCCDRRHQGLSRPREGSKDRIPLRVDLLAALFLNGRADKSAALRQDVRIGITQLLEQTRRPLDVGEEEGDRPGRQAGHGLLNRSLVPARTRWPAPASLPGPRPSRPRRTASARAVRVAATRSSTGRSPASSR